MMRDLRAHRRMRRTVGAYLDGELAPVAAAEMAYHLAVCWECSIATETIRLLKRALESRRPDSPSLVGVRLRRFAEDLAAGGGTQ